MSLERTLRSSANTRLSSLSCSLYPGERSETGNSKAVSPVCQQQAQQFESSPFSLSDLNPYCSSLPHWVPANSVLFSVPNTGPAGVHLPPSAWSSMSPSLCEAGSFSLFRPVFKYHLLHEALPAPALPYFPPPVPGPVPFYLP